MGSQPRRRFKQILSGFRNVRVVVAGDLIADEFIYGRIERVSREAPVLILGYDATEIVPGGAGNAASNAAALGATVEVVGVVGRDAAGDRMLDALPPRARTRSVCRADVYVTPVKTRILAGGVHSAKQQVVRIDRAGGVPDRPIARAVESALARTAARADAVIVSDYGSGLITPALWRRALRASRRKNPPITLVDSRYALGAFTGMTACTPNEPEVEALLGRRIGENGAALEDAGRTLLRQLETSAVLITRGSRGMAMFERGKPMEQIPIVGSDQVTDVTGAGDTVIATFTLALAAGATFSEAAHLANHAAGLVVMKRGTATVTAQELLASIEHAWA
jgi:D-glycero-beta-D-manno-heptose-7-phosphate kinase